METRNGGNPGEPGSAGNRCCALIVTYNCADRVAPTFDSVAPQVEKVFLIDNGSSDGTAAFLGKLRHDGAGRVDLVLLEKNIGIAGALNLGMQRAMTDGYEWVLTMDHDSVAEEGMVARLFDACEGTPDRESVLLAAPVFVNRETGRAGELYRYEGWRGIRLTDLIPRRDILDPTVVITSGNLVRTEAYAKAGGFDERLFVDFVDHDFCLRGRLAGLKVVCATKARIAHSVGNPVRRTIFGLTFSSTNHSPARRYTMTRNLAEMVRRYGRTFPAYALHAVSAYLRDLAAVLVCENERREKFRMMAKGLRDSRGHFARAAP